MSRRGGAPPAGDELLPERFEEFRSLSYWDGFFKKRGAVPFEWYSEWAQLRPLLRAAVRADAAADGAQPPPHATPGGRVLVVGCGNSELSAQMYDDGFEDITNIDFSKVCIASMMGKHIRARPKMRWQVMDATAMKFGDGAFDTVVDKGALDALMGDPGAAGAAQGSALLAECARVAHAGGGVVAVVSLLQDHVLEALMRTFRAGWHLSVRQVPPAPDMLTSPLQPFLVVARAQPPPPPTPGEPDADADALHYPAALPAQPVELHTAASSGGGRGSVINAEQLRDVALLVARENAARAAGTALGGFPPGGDPFRELVPGRRVVLPLGGASADGSPRFRVAVVDAPPPGRGPQAPGPPPPARAAAVFLVPQGREHEWLFGSADGQRALAASTGAARLIVVAFGRGHAFGAASAVQAELSPLVLPLAPAAARAAAAAGVGAPIPYMTTSEGIGERAAVAEATSALSGRILVEDVLLEGGTTSRRMVFAANANLVQSEVHLRPAKDGGGVDGSVLACDYHAAIVAGLAVAVPALAAGGKVSADVGGGDSSLPRLMVVGLGGGALPSFLAAHFDVAVEVVELDADVAALAEAHFGFAAAPPRLSLAIGCGAAAVAAAPRRSLRAIVLDAGSGDASLAMTCPPPLFLESPFLAAAAAALADDGVLVVNCVSRSAPAFAAALAALRAVFPVLLQAEAEAEHLNRVVFACKAAPPAAAGPGPARAAAAALRASARAPLHQDLDLETLAEGMHALVVQSDIESLD